MNLSRFSKNIENRRFSRLRLALDSNLDSKNEHKTEKQKEKAGQKHRDIPPSDRHFQLFCLKSRRASTYDSGRLNTSDTSWREINAFLSFLPTIVFSLLI